MAKQLSCGIVGLPNVGKSTLFNATTSNKAEAANYPFCTIEPNVGVVDVPDPRLGVLSSISHSSKIVPASLRFVDIAGLVEGASQGMGLGNQFLTHIRETDAILHVVRCFDSEDVIHVNGKVDPIKDINVINSELILSDLQMVENVMSRLEKQVKTKKELQIVLDLMKRIEPHLSKNLPVSGLNLTEEEMVELKPYPFLTTKKMIYVANVSESDLPQMSNAYVELVKEHAKKEGNIVIPICASLEEEIAQLDVSERGDFLSTVGLQESGLDRLVKASFEMLGLITFLTTGQMETRAWTIEKGDSAFEAAGEIHTDIQKGFVRAEVIKYQDYVDCNGSAGAKQKGVMRAEGRDYIMQDGDVVLFLHH